VHDAGLHQVGGGVHHATEDAVRVTNRSFALGLIVGLSLFGAVTFLPIYLQVVKGVSPSASGLLLMPMMLGMLVTSVVSGRIISRFGRYKLFPILGTGTMTFGLGALSLLSAESNVWETTIDALWLGLGMGMVMQVLIIAVQNSVSYEHLGVATSGTMLFRSLGGALGVALFGAIFANRLHDQLAGPGMRAIVVVKDGRIVAERYGEGFNSATPLLGWSITKSVQPPRIASTVAPERSKPAP